MHSSAVSPLTHELMTAKPCLLLCCFATLPPPLPPASQGEGCSLVWHTTWFSGVAPPVLNNSDVVTATTMTNTGETQQTTNSVCSCHNRARPTKVGDEKRWGQHRKTPVSVQCPLPTPHSTGSAHLHLPTHTHTHTQSPLAAEEGGFVSGLVCQFQGESASSLVQKKEAASFASLFVAVNYKH